MKTKYTRTETVHSQRMGYSEHNERHITRIIMLGHFDDMSDVDVIVQFYDRDKGLLSQMTLTFHIDTWAREAATALATVSGFSMNNLSFHTGFDC